MGFLSFEKRNIILLLLFAYIQFIESSAITDITNGNKPIVEVIIILSFSNVPKLLAGILRIITIYQTKSKIHKKKITFGSKGVLIYSVMLIMEVTNQILFICHKRYIQNANTPIHLDLCLKGFQIFFITLFGYYLLDYSLLRHKKAGLIILSVGYGFTRLMSFIFSSEDSNSIEIIAILFQVAVNITDSFHEVFEKYLMQYKYQHFLKILFIQGLFDTIGLIISIVVLLFINKSDLENNKWFTENLKHLIPYSVSSFGYHFLRMSINSKLTPTHRIMSDSFYAIVCFFYYLIHDFSISNLIISFGYLLSFCGSLVYHEVIVINLFNINKDTKKSIQKRAIKEEKDSENLIEQLNKFDTEISFVPVNESILY